MYISLYHSYSYPSCNHYTLHQYFTDLFTSTSQNKTDNQVAKKTIVEKKTLNQRPPGASFTHRLNRMPFQRKGSSQIHHFFSFSNSSLSFFNFSFSCSLTYCSSSAASLFPIAPPASRTDPPDPPPLPAPAPGSPSVENILADIRGRIRKV